MAITWTSFLIFLSNNGLSGLSVSLALRIAFSLALPSLLKNPPGIFPAAYILSSTSTVSGKKSIFSEGFLLITAVTRTPLPPNFTSTELACLAILPVENSIFFSPIFISHFFSISFITFLLYQNQFVILLPG